MKRMFTWFLALALVLSLAPIASQAADTLKVEVIKEVALNPVTPEAPGLIITNTTKGDVQVTVEVIDEVTRNTLETQHFTLLQGDAPFNFNTHAYKMLQKNGDINTYRYRVTTAGGYRDSFYVAQIMHIDKQTNEISWTQWENVIFPRNSVCSFGPQFRVLTPELTKRWYMFTPIDLTIQGRQTFELVGGNMYSVGELYVDVYGDNVTVTYMYYHNGQTDKIKPLGEFLYFFPSYATITTVEHDQINSPFAFGVPFSIANQLGGDTNVLMFVRNTETFYRFPVPTKELQRNYPNSNENKMIRQHMLDIMDPPEGVELVNKHNYAG